MKKKDEIKVCLVGSSGGHLTHLYMLKPFWKDKNRFWVTFNKEDAKSLLEGEKVYPCYFPTNRSIKALIKNTKIAWNVLHKEKPDLIISCGAAVAVPFFYFLGNRKDMNRIYQAMDVFVFPSLFEGLGIVAIEAQAAGVPIVCSEGLPPETDITPIYRKLLLSDGAEKWANAALEI